MGVGLIVLLGTVAAAAVSSDALQRCAAMDSAVERLDCYDRLARTRREHRDSPPVTANTLPAEPSDPPAADRPPPVMAQDPSPPEQVAPASVQARGEDRFGKAEGARQQASDHIRARIERVRRAPLGQHILELSNGQVWMENEAGRRPIRAGREITIRQHRFHYELELQGRPDVAVHRVE